MRERNQLIPEDYASLLYKPRLQPLVAIIRWAQNLVISIAVNRCLMSAHSDNSNRWLEKPMAQTNFETACFIISTGLLYQSSPPSQKLLSAQQRAAQIPAAGDRRGRLLRGEIR